ncbi:type I-E CRISPR-associated protein Cas5/CasD [Desulfobacterales bacterium HSG16]|nr:type I-E CRISPR-associated protein Cas5/CasD [Desulfobacterales bacterium HSG16]
MRYLLMPIAAPMQSWGDTVVSGDDRTTWPFPTHSGIAGMICAALGVDRKDEDRLGQVHDGLDILVAEIRKGTIQQDYYSVKDVIRATGQTDGAIIGRKYYLADYLFLTVVCIRQECPFSLEQIGQALLFPCYALYAGRRAYTLSIPPVFHENGLPQIMEWDDPVDEISKLVQDSKYLSRIFSNLVIAEKLSNALNIYVDVKSDVFKRHESAIPGIPYRVSDRYHGRYRNWGYREFDEREIGILPVTIKE